MRWSNWLHSCWDPHFGVGLMVAARRDIEASLPLLKRIAISFGPIVVSSIVSAASALVGGWVALDARLGRIERDHLEVLAQFREKTATREEQIHEIRGDVSELSTRLNTIDSRMRDCDLAMTELRALQRHERDELEAQRQGKKR